MKTNDKISPVEIFSGTIWEVEMVKSLLQNAEIQSYLRDENIGTIAPWHTAPGGLGSVKVMVSSWDYEKAKLILSEYEKLNKDG